MKHKNSPVKKKAKAVLSHAAPAPATVATDATAQPVDADDIQDLRKYIHAITDDEAYWHLRVLRAFTGAGMQVWRIERQAEHPIWEVWLRRGSFDLAADNRQAARQLRGLLDRADVKVAADELTVLEQRQGRVKCVFMFSRGLAGVWKEPVKSPLNRGKRKLMKNPPSPVRA